MFDPVGGEAFQQSTRFVALDGRILVVGFASGEIPKVRANHVLYRSYSLLGVYVGAYSGDGAGRAYLAGCVPDAWPPCSRPGSCTP